MELPDFVAQVDGFSEMPFAEQIRIFAWYLHEHSSLECVAPADIRRCFADLHLHAPANVGDSLSALTEARPPQVLRTRKGYKLERAVREKYAIKYGTREASHNVDKLLSSLPSLLQGSQEAYLTEALTCFRCGAFRAAIIMAWNLAYDHLCEFILAKKSTEFNGALRTVFSKHKVHSVTQREHFQDMKESEVLQVCRTAGISSKSVDKILTEKLTKRNSCAHPSGVVVTTIHAEEYILDLIQNAVLQLK